MDNARILTFAFSFLTLAACGTTEEPFVGTDAGEDTAADTTPGTDTTPDTSPDAEVDIGYYPGCEGRDPSVTCLDTGCTDGFECVPSDDDSCVPSSCSCDDEGWMCTADCGQNYVCAPATAGSCPVAEPIGETCDPADDGLSCEWGTECCCGECFPSTVCECTGGSWACYATDACMIPSCEGRVCETDSDCESWEGTLECLDGVCTEVHTPDGGWSEGPAIPFTFGECDPTSTDAFDLNEMVVVDDTLSLTVSYSGGCAPHEFRLCWDGSFMESSPVQVPLVLQHDGNGDMCEAYPTEVLEVPLSELADAYREAYAVRAGSIILRLLDASATYEFR